MPTWIKDAAHWVVGTRQIFWADTKQPCIDETVRQKGTMRPSTSYVKTATMPSINGIRGRITICRRKTKYRQSRLYVKKTPAKGQNSHYRSAHKI